MNTYSKEQIARVVSMVIVVLGFFGFQSGVGADQITGSIDAIIINGVLLVSFLTDVYGYARRYFKGDVTVLGRRI